jgi:hypothetical protein
LAAAARRSRRRPPAPAPADPYAGGSIILKALVRFGIAAFAGWLAFLAAMDSGLGEAEMWLAVGGSFLAGLALTAFDPMRGFVHLLSETARWAIILGAVFGVLWVLLNPAG